MFLEKLSIQGFKSFAEKNELHFAEKATKGKKGLTAIVGPNGSGKSNVSDAVRWVLGEQSMKILRGKRAEDIIFSGSSKKGKLSMAQVSLYLNNEEGQADLEYSQIVISRRIYRNGESEYLINDKKVRLFDIQMLLAKSNFGQKTYSVIGQGMVEGFLNTTLTERKEFFDEATGVKQFQIKRDESLNKIKIAYENLEKTKLLLAEIEPHLKGLTRQVNKLRKREELEKSLKEKQLVYYAHIWHKDNNEFTRLSNEFLILEKQKFEKEKSLEIASENLEKLKRESDNNEEYYNLQKELNDKQNQKDFFNKDLSKIEAQIEIKLENQGKFDLSFLINKKGSLENEVNEIKKEIVELNYKTQEILQKKEDFDKQKNKLDIFINDFNKQISDLNIKIQFKIKDLAKKEIDFNLEQELNNLLDKIKLMEEEESFDVWKNNFKIVKELLNKIINSLNFTEKKEDNYDQEYLTMQAEWKIAQDKLNNLQKEKEKFFSAINEQTVFYNSTKNQINFLENKLRNIDNEIKAIEQKIKQQTIGFDFGELEKEKEALKIKIKEIDVFLADKKDKLNLLKTKEDKKRSELFFLQKDLQDKQNEFFTINNQLNKIKVEQTRYETRLENIETEIRTELGDLRQIKDFVLGDDIDFGDFREKIKQTKKSLEQIGGIDPLVEDEFNQTKQRFDFLSFQLNDFIDTVDALEKVIKKLDLMIKEKFDKEFKIISDKFEEYFKILFNGGTAKVIKVLDEEIETEKNKNDNENIFDLNKIKFLQKNKAMSLAGIEIKACPPGKKINSISMLSGGERALTAIAMISAIISANPSPFVFLDEVDAALDEANSERLAKILDDLSHKTQFIVVTHNRSLMRKANILYGVTMGDDGVSKLLSVKLNDE